MTLIGFLSFNMLGLGTAVAISSVSRSMGSIGDKFVTFMVPEVGILPISGSTDFFDNIILVNFVGCLVTGTGFGRLTVAGVIMKLLRPEAGVVGLETITNLLVGVGDINLVVV